MTFPHDPFDGPPHDPELDERLARLSARSSERRAAAAGPRHAASPPSPSRRRSAARGSRSAALGMSIVSTIGLAGYLYAAAHSASAATATVDTSGGTGTTSASTAATTATTAATSSGTASTSTTTSSSLANGTYTGTSVTTKFGPVQVQITVSNGQITAVTVPTYPSDDSKSRSINATVVPKLVQSTLTAQSASVSTVSGATYTTNAYKQSLQSAIDQARAAATTAR